MHLLTCIDGYMPLLVQSEGGQAEEIVDEENGILISTILRQYFMGLRTVGQWKNLAESWISVASDAPTPLSAATTKKPANDECNKTTAQTGDSQKPAEKSEGDKAWSDFLQRRLGLNKTPINDDSDSDSEGEPEDPDAVEDDAMDFEVLLMRKFWTRWAVRAKVKASVCDPLKEGEMSVDWTRTIAPVLEGRIKMAQAQG